MWRCVEAGPRDAELVSLDDEASLLGPNACANVEDGEATNFECTFP